MDLESLKKVSPSATEKKLGYVLVDAVGVTASKKGNSRQLERISSAPLKDLDIVSLIRFELGYTKELDLYAAEVNLKFRDWIFKKNAGNIQFNEEQTAWLQMIRDHVAVSLSITKDDLDLDPFGEQGGLARFFQLFGNKYEDILKDINEALAA